MGNGTEANATKPANITETELDYNFTILAANSTDRKNLILTAIVPNITDANIIIGGNKTEIGNLTEIIQSKGKATFIRNQTSNESGILERRETKQQEI
jgi:hypothetical protein